MIKIIIETWGDDLEKKSNELIAQGYKTIAEPRYHTAPNGECFWTASFERLQVPEVCPLAAATVLEAVVGLLDEIPSAKNGQNITFEGASYFLVPPDAIEQSDVIKLMMVEYCKNTDYNFLNKGGK